MMKNPKNHYFITVEGIEGAGKSTAMNFIRKYLENAKIPLVVTREPGGTPVAEEIRKTLLKKHTEPVCSDTELLLMFASRAQHIHQVILPALTEGKWVLCDRFTDASYAYQGGGRGINPARIAVLENWVQGELQPDLTLLLDVPVKVGLERAKRRGKLDRIEAETKRFFEGVRKNYLARAAEQPERFKIINANKALFVVKEQIVSVLDSLLLEHFNS